MNQFIPSKIPPRPRLILCKGEISDKEANRSAQVNSKDIKLRTDCTTPQPPGVLLEMDAFKEVHARMAGMYHVDKSQMKWPESRHMRVYYAVKWIIHSKTKFVFTQDVNYSVALVGGAMSVPTLTANARLRISD